ncbi:MAG TPA: sulfite exporter TauE/SafE family protein, partial [Flavobacteriales bacterium]|nr:sulfite exporter TauE/SafE family protein [Flavobacteriales bacterium]
SRALALLESPANAINDRQVQHMLRLLTRTKLRVRQGRKNTLVDAPVDFSALSSEYIGILYEGLLDFELKQAAQDDPVVFLAVRNYYKAGVIDPKVVAFIAVAFVLGSYFGSKWSLALPMETVRKVFGGIILLVALKLILGK